MGYSKILNWDVSTEAPAEPETWVCQRGSIIKVCDGLPNIVVDAWGDGREVYRHTPDGRLWKKVS